MAWHPDNNINNSVLKFSYTDGKTFFTTDKEALKVERQIVNELVTTLNDIDNLLWEIVNEAGPSSVVWQNDMVNYVKTYESRDSSLQKHLVGITGGYRYGENNMLNRTADWISPDWGEISSDGYTGYCDGGPADYTDKIVISDTDHLCGWGFSETNQVDEYTKWVWKTFMRGNHPIFMDYYDAAVPSEEVEGGEVDPAYDPVRKAMGCTLAVANTLTDLADMIPSETAAETGYALVGQQNGEYVVYQPVAGPFRVDLPTGNYTYIWLDPETCATTIGESGNVDGGSPVQFSPPSNTDPAVLVLRRVN